MAENSAAAASTAAVPAKITTTVKLVGVKGAAPTGFEHDYGDTVGVLAGMIGAQWKHFVQSGTVHLHEVPDSKKRAAKSAFIRNEEDARTNYGAGDAIDPEESLTANSFLLAIGNLTPAAAPPAASGTCPHSIVFPSVARSSLTWSRCLT